MFGLTRNTTSAEICRAALESVCYQTKDLMDALSHDSDQSITQVSVDGGMTSNTFMVQFLCDLLGLSIRKPMLTEITALGAAYLAGLHGKIFKSFDDIAKRQPSSMFFAPIKSRQFVLQKYKGWGDAVKRTRGII